MDKPMRFLLSFLLTLLIFGCSSPINSTYEFSRKPYAPWEKDIGYVQVVRSGNTLHLAGVTGEGGTFEQQMKSIYKKIQAILSDFDASTSNISKEVIYTTNMELLKQAIPLRKQYYPNELYPSSSWVQVEQLFSPSSMLEVAVTVTLPN